jgi:hypothetical protein
MRTATRRSSGCAAARPILSIALVGPIVPIPRVVASATAQDAEMGMNGARTLTSGAIPCPLTSFVNSLDSWEAKANTRPPSTTPITKTVPIAISTLRLTSWERPSTTSRGIVRTMPTSAPHWAIPKAMLNKAIDSRSSPT